MLIFSLSTYTISEYTQSLITDFLLKTHTFGPDLYHGEVFPHSQSLVVSDISFVKRATCICMHSTWGISEDLCGHYSCYLV